MGERLALRERGLVISCAVGIVAATTAMTLLTGEAIATPLGCLGIALFGFVLGRIHGAREWRELVRKVVRVHADVETIRRWDGRASR